MNMLPKLLAATSLTVLMMAVQAAHAEDVFADRLLGDVAGKRSALLDAGVDATLEYTGDVWHVSGGIKDGYNYNGHAELGLDIDGEKVFGIKGNKVFVSAINDHGSHTNASRVGSTQGVDNIETAPDTTKLYEAFVDQSFMDDKVSVLFGLRDLNAEFYVNDMAGNFILPTMGIGQSFAQSGVNGPSVFPNTALAGRIKIKPCDESYLSLAVFDGVAGDPAHPHGTHQKLKSDDGLLLVGEAGLTPKAVDSEDELNKFAVGFWSYTKQFDDLVDVDSAGNPMKHRSQGIYFLSSYNFYHDKAAGQDVGAFFRIGVADEDVSQTGVSYETGLVAKGFMPTRPEGELGLGLSQAQNSDPYMTTNPIANRHEYQVELYYRDQLMRGVSIQPDVQFIKDMSTDNTIDDAVVAGLRVALSF